MGYFFISYFNKIRFFRKEQIGILHKDTKIKKIQINIDINCYYFSSFFWKPRFHVTINLN